MLLLRGDSITITITMTISITITSITITTSSLTIATIIASTIRELAHLLRLGGTTCLTLPV